MNRRLGPLLAFAVALVGAPASAHAQADAGHAAGRKLEDTPTLAVSGKAELERPADRANLSIGVTTEASDAGEAMERNNAIMRTVVEALEKAGLEKSEYETGRFFLRPTYAPRPRVPADDWKPKIDGYEVSNSVRIRTTKLDRVGDFVEAANRAGANNVSVQGFDLADPLKYRIEAIRTATAQALAEASALADAAGLRLVRIVRIHLDQDAARPMEMAFAANARMAGDAGGPPIVAGDVTIAATVNIVYEIAPLGADAHRPDPNDTAGHR